MSTIKYNGINIYESVPISKIFIKEYMPKADASFVKVYLYGLNICLSGNKELDNKYISEKLSLLESDVINAWKYWHKEGLVDFSIDSNGNSNLDFLNTKKTLNIKKKTPDIKKEIPEKIIIDTRPTYSQKEISLNIKNDYSLSYIYKHYEKLSGKPVSSSDISIIYSLYDWLKLSPEVIIYLLEYCFEKGKKSLRYIEKVALDWAEKELYDLSAVEKYLKIQEKQNSVINKVKKAFGIFERQMSKPETKYIEKWIYEYGFDINILSYAYDLTIINTGNLSFPYINSILTSWEKKGVKTLKDAEQLNVKRKNVTKTINMKNNSAINNNNNKNFSKINTRTYDFKEIEKLAKSKKLR